MITTQLHIEATPDEVFDVLADAKRYADWVVGAKKIRHVDADFPRPGSRLHHTLGVLALTAKDSTRVIRAERPRLLELDAHARGLRAIVRFVLEPDETGTTVVMEEGGANAVSRVLARRTRTLIRARNAETLWRLRTQLETGGDVSEPTPTPVDTQVPLPRWLGDVTARAFGIAGAVRRGRAFHPRGVTRTGVAQLTGRGALLVDEVGEVLVRFSRGAGLPARFPDVNGVAVRFVDAWGAGRHRDLLFAGSGPGILGRLIVPSIDFGATRFSTILGYRLGGEPVVFVADVRPRRLTLAELGGPDPVELRLFASTGSDLELLATISLGDVVDGATLCFDPIARTPNLEPTGFLNALRAPAYAASQAARVRVTPPEQRETGSDQGVEPAAGAASSPSS